MARTTMMIAVEAGLRGRLGPPARRSPGRSTRDQSMFPQSPRPGPFLTGPCYVGGLARVTAGELRLPVFTRYRLDTRSLPLSPNL